MAFALFNFQIVKAANITVDDVVNNFEHLVELGIVDQDEISITKEGSKITITYKEENVEVNFNYNNDEITYQFTGDKSKADDLKKASKYDANAINYLLISIIDLQGKNIDNAVNDVINVWSNIENITYQNNGLEIKEFVISHSDDEEEAIVGEFVESVKININKLNLDNLQSDDQDLTITDTGDGQNNNSDENAGSDKSNEKIPDLGVKETILYILGSGILLSLILLSIKKFNKFIKIK